MLINLENIVSISDANRNFSQVARKVDADGPVVVMKNNRPRYVVIPYNSPQAGGISMRKMIYKRLSVARPATYFELQVVQAGEGLRLETSGVSEKRAARQTQLFQAYVALYAVKRLGLEKARLLLDDEGDVIAVERLGLPMAEDEHALPATWFSRALLADSDRQRLMALYNAYGALPGGYTDVEHIVRSHLGQQEAAAFLEAVAAEQYDEGDLADQAAERPIPNHQPVRFDAHFMALADIIA